ncbi:hypothetical protein [Photorhabdus laumondii]
MGALFLILLLPVIVFFHYRNSWVYQVRKHVLSELGLKTYKQLAPYDVMVFKFWVWNWQRFLSSDKKRGE